MQEQQDKVDMGSLTQKELLILLNHQVTEIKTRITIYETDSLALKLKMNELETKMKLWAAIIAFVSGVGASLIIEFLKS